MPPDRIKNQLFTIAGVSIIAGSAAGFGSALPEIIRQGYQHYGLYTLMCLILQKNLAGHLIAACAGGAAGAFAGAAAIYTKQRCFSRSGRRQKALCAAAAVIAGICVLTAAAASARTAFFSSPARIIAAAAVFAAAWIIVSLPKGRLLSRAAAAVKCLALVALIFIFILYAVPAATSLTAAGRPNIVLIVIDCLRADHLGCYGYGRNTSPAIDALAGAGTVFSRAYAQAPWTKPSVASLFTSLYPHVHNIISPGSTMPDALVTTAEALKSSGYHTAFFNGGNLFVKKDFNVDQGFTRYLYRPYAERAGEAITHDFLRYIQNTNNTPFFAYIHYMDAHTPYKANMFTNTFLGKKPLRTHSDRGSVLKKIRLMTKKGRLSPEEKQQIVDLYDGQIRYIDENIKNILLQLKNSSLLDNTILIITADHGEEFWDHHNFEHGHTLYNELLHIPLIIAGRAVSSKAVSAPVQLIDIHPTILALAGTEPCGAPMQGRNLLAPPGGAARPANRAVFATATLYGTEKMCVIKNGHKYIHNTERSRHKWKLIGYASPDTAECYNLDTDPSESVNRAPHCAESTNLTAALETFLQMPPVCAEQITRAVIDKNTKKQLEALGYIN
jgi:arylsulfatase A-like enzyme